MTHALFAIGPLDGTNEQNGRIAYFLHPGVPGMPVLFGNRSSQSCYGTSQSSCCSEFHEEHQPDRRAQFVCETLLQRSTQGR